MCWPSHDSTFSLAVSVATVVLAASQQKCNWAFQYGRRSHIMDFKEIHKPVFSSFSRELKAAGAYGWQTWHHMSILWKLLEPHPPVAKRTCVVIRFVIPVVFNKLTRVQCMYRSNTTVFDGRCLYSIYYITYNYMFRRLTTAIFRLYMIYLVSSYTRLNVGCIQWRSRSWVELRSRVHLTSYLPTVYNPYSLV